MAPLCIVSTNKLTEAELSTTKWETFSTCCNYVFIAQSLYCLPTECKSGVRSPEEAEDFSSSLMSRPALGPTQPPIQWVLEDLSPGGKERPKRDADHSPHLVPRSGMSGSYTSSPHKLPLDV